MRQNSYSGKLWGCSETCVPFLFYLGKVRVLMARTAKGGVTLPMLLSCSPFCMGFSDFSFKVLIPIQSFLFFHRNLQNLFPSEVKNIDTVATGRAAYTDRRNLQDLKVNYFYVSNFGPLLQCLARLGLAGQKLRTLTMLPCGITSQAKFHGNEEMSFPHLQLCALFKACHGCKINCSMHLLRGGILDLIHMLEKVFLGSTGHCIAFGGLLGRVCLHSAWILSL